MRRLEAELAEDLHTSTVEGDRTGRQVGGGR
jgi:hypothetical protein